MLITTFIVQSQDQILQNKTFDSAGQGTGNKATIKLSYDMPICCLQVGTHYACTNLSVAVSTGRKYVTIQEKCKVGNVGMVSPAVPVVVVPCSQEGTINDGLALLMPSSSGSCSQALLLWNVNTDVVQVGRERVGEI